MSKHHESDLIARLSARFSAPEWAFLSHVRNTTGYSKRVRTADGMAMSLYPSRGLHLHGFEVKVHRSDWLRELKDPAKAEEIGAFCHFWNIVAPDTDCVKAEELPGAWGLYVCHGEKLRQVRQATLNQHVKSPDMMLLAGILRNVSEGMVPAGAVREIAERKHKEDIGRIEGQHLQAIERERRNFQQLRDSVQDFEKRSGLNVLSYHGPRIRTEVEALEAMRGNFGRQKVTQLEEFIATLQGSLRSAIEFKERIISGRPEPEYSI